MQPRGVARAENPRDDEKGSQGMPVADQTTADEALDAAEDAITKAAKAVAREGAKP